MSDSQDFVQKYLVEEPTIVDKFAYWVERDGNRPFLLYGDDDRRFSYSEFDLLTNSLANGFKALGATIGSRISVFSANSLVAISTMFACWKVGAVYCPVNSKLTKDLLSYVLNDTEPQLLVVDQGLLCHVDDVSDALGSPPTLIVHRPKRDEADFDAAKVSVGTPNGLSSENLSELITQSSDPLLESITEENQSSIIYTSGTTGNPKGVVHRHSWLRGLCFGLATMTHPDDVLYCDLPMHHIGGAFSNVGRAAWAGASIGVWSKFNTQDFWSRINKSKASITILLDVMSDWIMQQPPTSKDRENTVIRAHMQPLPDNHGAMAKRFGIDFVAVGYGSTEVGLGHTGLVDEFPNEIGTPSHLWKGYSKQEIRELVTMIAGAGAIVDGTKHVEKGFMGMPVGHYAPRVVDDDGKDVPPTVPGQLLMQPRRPEFLFSEYFGKPEETAKALTVDGFNSADIVRKDTEGVYYFCDRKQGFIRVRGENVAASVVESNLNGHEKVSYSAVVGVPALSGYEDDIAAFVVPSMSGALTESEIAAWAQEEMPKFMWPKYIRVVDTLPVTPTMKVEKYKLKDQILREIEESKEGV